MLPPLLARAILSEELAELLGNEPITTAWGEEGADLHHYQQAVSWWFHCTDGPASLPRCCKALGLPVERTRRWARRLLQHERERRSTMGWSRATGLERFGVAMRPAVTP